MGLIRATMLFNIDRYTWSESHYLVGVSAILGPAIARATALANARAACLGNGAILNDVRISDSAFPRNVTFLPDNTFNTKGGFPTDPTFQVWDAERPYSSLLVQLYGVNQPKSLYLAGIPDGSVGTTPNNQDGLILQNAFMTQFAAYIMLLANGQYGFREKNLAAGTPVQTPLVSNVLFPNQIGITLLVPLPGVVAGSQILLKGFRRANTKSPGLAGRWTVSGTIPAVPSSPTTYFLANTGNVLPGNFPILGSAYALAYAIDPYQMDPNNTGSPKYNVKAAVSRRRGGSVGLPRGRRAIRR